MFMQLRVKAMAAVIVLGTAWFVTSVAHPEAAGVRATRLEYRDRCGWGTGEGIGTKVWLHNILSNQSVVVTVRTTVTGNGQRGSDGTHRLAAGEQLAIGCTEGMSLHSGSRTYAIVGEEIVGGRESGARTSPAPRSGRYIIGR
jgi:hypothetical protein